MGLLLSEMVVFPASSNNVAGINYEQKKIEIFGKPFCREIAKSDFFCQMTLMGAGARNQGDEMSF
jgi:hypothetical protein